MLLVSIGLRVQRLYSDRIDAAAASADDADAAAGEYIGKDSVGFGC